MEMFYGNRLTLLRMLKGLSMQELADKTGLSKQAISKFESGELKPAYATMVGIGKIFDMPDEYFTKKEVNIKLNGSRVEILNK